METKRYRYQLRRGEELVATGHLTQETPLAVGDTLTLGQTHGTIAEIGPRLADGEIRLVVHLPDNGDPARPRA